jgi:cytochrome c-type biogenesis protein CcmH
MVWLVITLLAALALAPLLLVLRRGATARGAQASALALHRAQLVELDRDLAEGRIMPAEHATARLEVQRRLLAVAERPDAAGQTGARWPILAVAVLVPAAALGLYLIGGQPGMPSLPPGSGAVRQQRAMEEAALIGRLRERLLTLDPASDQALQGYLLLGNVEEARGNDAAAAAAWERALAGRFDTVLAVRAVDAMVRAEGSLSVRSAALLRRALAAAPADVPWRGAAEQRLRDSGL